MLSATFCLAIATPDLDKVFSLLPDIKSNSNNYYNFSLFQQSKLFAFPKMPHLGCFPIV